MRKREFLKKAGLLSGSLILVPSSGSIIRSADNKYENQDEAGSAIPFKLVTGSDHAGFPLKGPLMKVLQSWGYSVKDVGSFTPDPVDFPDIAILLADEIIKGRAERGIMVCGTGVGAAIACNKIQGIRAALCHDTYSAHQCVEHDNVNVLCIGAQIIGQSIAEEIIKNFLNAKFSTEEQFRRRVKKLDGFDLVPPRK
ncbi:MAG: RpiB/LacA/LacB family sugar-phosphate isomerase [Bacteroidia bacterium]|nr:RpiB/LacA/LacB family sugar-phosphate isomerase [Bacteroidia bacterium]